MSATGMQSRRPLLGWTIHDSLIIARSTITASFRIPEALFFQLIQPVIFVLLFAAILALDLEQRIFRQLLGDDLFDLGGRQREQLDRLLQLLGHHQLLGLANIEAGS